MDTPVPAEPDTEDAPVTIEIEDEQSEASVTEQLEQVEVPVTWTCEAYDAETTGTYVFTSQLMENYIYSEEMPQIGVVVLEAENTATDDGETAESTPTPDGAVMLDDATLASPEPTLTLPEAYQITAFTNEPIAIEVPRGTAITDIPLPETLPAINALGEQVEVPVTWVNITQATEEYENDPNDYVSGNLSGYGPWVFTAMLVQPQIIATEATNETTEVTYSTTEGTEPAPTTPTYAYSYTGEPVSASVTLPDCTTIESIGGFGQDETVFRFVIFQGGSLSLPDEITAFMTDGGTKNVPVYWSGSYDANTVGDYRLEMSVGGAYSSYSAKAVVSVIRDYTQGEE